MSGSPGREGEIVRYRVNATTAYQALITKVNPNGTVELTTFPPGSSPATQSAVIHDASESKPGRWHHQPS